LLELAVDRGAELDECNARLADIAKFNAAVPAAPPAKPTTLRERLRKLMEE
jgi:hypothetical protein